MNHVVEWDDNRHNGIDVDELSDVIREFHRDAWQGRTRSETTVESHSIGGERVARKFNIARPVKLEPTLVVG